MKLYRVVKFHIDGREINYGICPEEDIKHITRGYTFDGLLYMRKGSGWAFDVMEVIDEETAVEEETAAEVEETADVEEATKEEKKMGEPDIVAALIKKGFEVIKDEQGFKTLAKTYGDGDVETLRVIVKLNANNDTVQVICRDGGYRNGNTKVYPNATSALNAIRANIIREGYDFDAPTAEAPAVEETAGGTVSDIATAADDKPAEEATQEAPMIADSFDEFVSKTEAAIREVFNNTEAGQQISKALLAGALKQNPNMTPEEWAQMKSQFMTFVFTLFVKENPQAMRELGTHVYNELRAS